MNIEVLKVRALLSALTAKVQDSREVLEAQHIGNAIYGLLSMNSDPLAVRALLSVQPMTMHEPSSASAAAA